MFESEKMKQICTDLHDIGMRLESKTICKIVEEAKRKLNYPSKLRVAFITDQFRGASMALKESFGLAALPEEIKPIQIVSSAKIVYTKQDVESNEPAYVLKKESEQPYSFMLGRKEDSLEYTDAQILYSRNNYEDFDWKIELAQVDYGCKRDSDVEYIGTKVNRRRAFKVFWIITFFDYPCRYRDDSECGCL